MTNSLRAFAARFAVPFAVLALCALLFGATANASVPTPSPVQPMPTAEVTPPMDDTITGAQLYADGWVALTFGPDAEELRVALLEAGFVGDPLDGMEAIYAPAWSVIDVPGGTWTVTPFGGMRCVDWATTGAECSDGVYLPWSPDFVGYDAP